MKSCILVTWEFRHPPNNQDENVEDFGCFFIGQRKAPMF
jgi:hypothetical protein